LATKIRLKRIGRRNRPFYRMVAMDSRNRRDGAAIEELGWYNPLDTERAYELKDDRILHWLGEGAQPTDAAKKLLRRAGLNHRWHLIQQGMEGAELEKEMKKWELNREDVLNARTERDEKKAKENAKKEVEAAPPEDATDDTPKEENPDGVGDDASAKEEDAKKEISDDSPSDEASMEEE